MLQNVTLKLLPAQAGNEAILLRHIAEAIGKQPQFISGFNIIRQSIDARGMQPWVNITATAYVDEPFIKRTIQSFQFPDVSHAASAVLIIGAGPAGLFAALKLIEAGIKPIIIERGKDIRSRRRDLAALNKSGIVDPDSNYCFGEGGAGTYSDGKLYTRSNKRGDIQRILNLFVRFGADEKILYEAHPHIGTNKLPQIIMQLRQQVIDCGGEFIFEKRVTGLILNNNRIEGVSVASGEDFRGDAVILATGHSARDIFELLHNSRILIAFKPFALGVRVEHPQQLIDSIQYHSAHRNEFLPPAAYSLVQQVNGRGVFSFCMCPGGIIAPAATSPGELVVNGWSPSKRNNPFANSGIVVPVEEADIAQQYGQFGPLAGMMFQQDVEKRAFSAGGGNLVAPAQRLADLCNDKPSSTLPDCSYIPGVQSASMKDVLPAFIHGRLRDAFRDFGRKMKGYLTNEALVVATESRTSSPVRIPRDKQTLQHPQITNLYPCSEGAGYAGGIVSAAMDGENVAAAITLQLKPRLSATS